MQAVGARFLAPRNVDKKKPGPSGGLAKTASGRKNTNENENQAQTQNDTKAGAGTMDAMLTPDARRGGTCLRAICPNRDCATHRTKRALLVPAAYCTHTHKFHDSIVFVCGDCEHPYTLALGRVVAK